MACNSHCSSQKTDKIKTRSECQIWLIGTVNERMVNRGKLPSLRETLSVLFYHHKEQKNTLTESARTTVLEVLSFWQKAAIPTARSYDIEKRLLRVHAEWQCLKKAKNRRTLKQISNEAQFSSKLEQLFDVSHQDAETRTELKEDLEFLANQREGRKGYMGREDKAWTERQARKVKRADSFDRFKMNSKQEQEALYSSCSSAVKLSSDSSSGEEAEAAEQTTGSESEMYVPPKRKRVLSSIERKSLLSKDVTSALDRSKVTDRQAVHLLAAAAHSLGRSVDDVTVSRSSIQRARCANRSNTAADVKTSFDPQVPLTVHWDGKLLPDLVGREKVDRLPVIVTGYNVECLLGVPKLGAGTGQAQADAVVKCLNDWNLIGKVKGLCFDTTSSNTGRLNGACVLIERTLGQSLLHFACRHHVMEIVLEKVFTALKITSASSGPDIAIFKRFREKWSSIDKNSYETAAGMTEIDSFRERTLQFAMKNLQVGQPRDDYKEFLELAVIFLGGTPVRGFHVQAPGALHSARWMARVLYCYKMWMFKKQFSLKPSEVSGIFQFLLFVSDVYISMWFEATFPATAPANDLRFLKKLTQYNINPIVKQAALSALNRHLWYLSEVIVGLAFFDMRVDPQQKMQMLINMQQNEGMEQPSPRLDGKSYLADKQLSDFITTNTKAFFTILGVPQSFLLKPPETWNDNEDFKIAERIVRSLKVVNDTAERGVKLIQDFNQILTKDEDQKQYLLQVVQEHRKLYPDSKKCTVVSGLNKTAGIQEEKPSDAWRQ